MRASWPVWRVLPLTEFQTTAPALIVNVTCAPPEHPVAVPIRDSVATAVPGWAWGVHLYKLT